ncbi:variable surface protein [Plasmodium gonderi]|uniref:Variable surface protein n=1 Tax=Plasmodium gonderi TaxID=77519 RepID=A0A1Y1JQA6_PLAGO|nr:variable surface protein [Plasmodium gonderi]GAW84671.1 variable surface protein [Plasmodium gonderi]
MVKQLNDKQCYEAFFKIRDSFNTSYEAHYTNILNTNDPFLRNIAFYLIEIYSDAKTFCYYMCDDDKEDCKEKCKKYCKYLNDWLNEKKSLYTSHGMCEYNKKIWNEYIEKLWETLTSQHEKIWCERKNTSYTDTFPNKLIPKSCNNNSPIEFSINCQNIEDSSDLVYSPSCSTLSRFSIFAASIGYVFFGIITLYISIYKFSPMNSWMRYFIRDNKMKLQNIYKRITQRIPKHSDKANEEYLNSNFHVLYDSFLN